MDAITTELFEDVTKNMQTIAHAKSNPAQLLFLKPAKFGLVAEDAASTAYSNLLEVLETIKGGHDLLYAYDTLARFDVGNASLMDMQDAKKAILKIWEMANEKVEVEN